ncbi:D-alanyl-D-alanine carboxypeptidase/D-alanyl-D-alanine-endopeptidase [Streptomyces sp. E11-3]
MKLPELPRPERTRRLQTWQLTAGAATAGLALAAGLVTAAGPWDSGQRTAEREWAASQSRDGGADHGRGDGRGTAKGPRPAPSAPGVLAALKAPTGAGPGPAKDAIADVLDPLLKDPSLGQRSTGSVVDAVTGEELYGVRTGDAVTPASTIKIATAVAALSALGPDHRIETRVVAGPDEAEITLVGGGDPTLSARKDTDGGASLRTLADDTAKALKDRSGAGRGDAEVRLSYDASLYSGPVLHPIGPNDNIAPVMALAVDQGRLDDSTRGPAPRVADPALEAARAFAGLLRDRGVEVQGEPHPAKANKGDKKDKGAKGAKGAKTLAQAKSAPLSALVERMLTRSDNDIAEALVRQTALAADEPASFAGARRAVTDQLAELELPLGGARFADGSGLDRADKVTVRLLTALLARAADPDHPELRPALTGLPVAGFTGTLRNRYADPDTASATGLVRAKTGTLTGVNTLAGTVVDADGRLLAFAFTASGTTDPHAAKSTLDRLAATVTNCACH